MNLHPGRYGIVFGMNEWWEETLGFPPTTHFQISVPLLLFLVEARTCAQVDWRRSIVAARGSR